MQRPEHPQAHDKLSGSFQIALREGPKFLTSWGDVTRCAEYVFLFPGSGIMLLTACSQSSLADVSAEITTDFWESSDILGIGARDNAASIAAALVASLFYIQVGSRATCGNSLSHKLVVLCRLEPGPHLITLLRGLKELGSRIHYRVHEARQESVLLCSDDEFATCKAGRPFSRFLRDIDTLDVRIHVYVDSLTQAGAHEPISNSPCMARGVAVAEKNTADASSTSSCSSEMFSGDTDPDTVSSAGSTVDSSRTVGVLHTGAEKGVRIVKHDSAESDRDEDEVDGVDTSDAQKDDGVDSHSFYGIDHLQELLVQIRRQNR